MYNVIQRTEDVDGVAQFSILGAFDSHQNAILFAKAYQNEWGGAFVSIQNWSGEYLPEWGEIDN